MGYTKRNVDRTNRNGKSENGKVIVQYITREGRNGKDGGDGYSIFLNNTSHVFESGPVYASDGQSDYIQVIALRGNELIPARVGTIEGTVTGALTATITNNDSSVCSIRVDVNSLLTDGYGVLTIPVTVNTDGIDYLIDSSTGQHVPTDSSTGESIFDTQTYNTGTVNLKYSWSLAKAAGDVRGYTLDLDNQAAGINCDSSGNILPGAVRPNCKATLKYGVTEIIGAIYELELPEQDVTGLTINESTGELAFDSSFGFTGTSLEIQVNGYDNDSYYWVVDTSTNTKTRVDVDSDSRAMVASAIMTVTKSYPGVDGTPATSYWLSCSTSDITIDVNNDDALSPGAMTIQAYKQVGENAPETAADASIYWGYDTDSPSTLYTGTIQLTAKSGGVYRKRLVTKLMKGNIQVDIETIPFIREGKDGINGLQGRRGATVRGPVNYEEQTTTRRFCNGELTDTNHPEDALWLDVIRKDSSIYYCNTSYTGSCNDTWSSVSSNWTASDQQFDFMATKLLLANNANIDFLSGNEIYLKDSSSNVTGGAAGGNGINFWAGGATPSTAPYRVSNDGSFYASNANITGIINATSGIFSGFLKMPFKSFDEGATYNSSDDTYTVSDSFNLSSEAYHWSGAYEITLKLPASSSFSGAVLTVFDMPVKTKSSPTLHITCESGAYIYHPSKLSSTYGLDTATSIYCVRGGLIQFVCVSPWENTCYWIVITDMMPEAIVS